MNFKLKKLRTNRKEAREDNLVYAKRKISPRKFLRQQKHYETIQKIMTQQKYMLDYNVDSVPNRIISYHQSFLRPIVRGKAKTPTEFEPKVVLSQSNGFVRIERISFDAFNESTDFHQLLSDIMCLQVITRKEFLLIKSIEQRTV